VVGDFCSWLRMRKVPVKKEFVVTPDRKYRVDLWARTDDGVIHWCDVSIPEPGRQSYLDLGSAATDGIAAKKAEANKRSKWTPLAPVGVQVVPLVIETTGSLGDSAVKFINRVTADGSGPSRARLVSQLSVTLAKWNVECSREAGRHACAEFQ
jgi:hypothetical protein